MRYVEPPYRVYIGLVSLSYLDPEAISQTIRDGIVFCGVAGALEKLKPGARVVCKPDVYLANAKNGRYGYTHPEVTRATLSQILTFTHNPQIEILAETNPEIAGFRTLKKANAETERFHLRGYYEFEHLYPKNVSVTPSDEAESAWYHLSYGGVLSASEKNRLACGLDSDWESSFLRRASNEIKAPRCFSKADFSIYCPKIKTSVLSQGFSGAIALGNARKQEGLFNDHRMVDSLEICNPQLIVGDGIIADRGNELGVLLISNNALAHDWIAAQILNLDPMKIPHLKMAAARRWGPQNASQIELSGAGRDGIEQLAQKSRYWDSGTNFIQDFKKKYENENPGLRFPLEIQTGATRSGDQDMLLEWLYNTYDFPRWRARMAQWPRASICIGGFKSFPQQKRVYVFGTQAIAHFKHLTSSTRTLFQLNDCKFSHVQLKNGSKHFVIQSEHLTQHRLTRAFSVGSLGRMTIHLLQFSTFFDQALFRFWSRWRFSRSNIAPQFPIVMTNRLSQNRWWTLRRPEAKMKKAPV